jgi:hypothetical protein
MACSSKKYQKIAYLKVFRGFCIGFVVGDNYYNLIFIRMFVTSKSNSLHFVINQLYY